MSRSVAAPLAASGLVFAALVVGDAAQPKLFEVTFQSSLLSQYLKRRVEIGASVLLPDSYYKDAASRRYPVIYVVPAFEGTDDVTLIDAELQWQRPMQIARPRVHRRHLARHDEYRRRVGSQ